MSGVDNLKDRYVALERSLEHFNGADERYEHARQQYQYSARNASHRRSNFEQSESAYQHAQAKADKARKSTLRKWFRPSKYEEKIEKWDQIRKKDLEQLVDAETELRTAEQNRIAARRELDGADEDHRQQQALIGEKRAVLDHVFEGANGNDYENSVEFERNRLRTKRDEAKSEMQRQATAKAHLATCEELLNKMLRLLQHALQNNTVDLFTGSPGFGYGGGFYGGYGGSNLISLYAGVQTNNNVHKAQELSTSARDQFQKAVDINPNIPWANGFQIEFGQLLSFTNIVFDSLLTDIIVRQKIQKARHTVVGAIQQVQRAAAYQDSEVQAKKSLVDSLEQQITTTEEVLYDVRGQILLSN